MKMKSFAILAASGMLAASIAYVAPAMADDTTNNASQPTQQTPSSDNMMQNQNTQNQNQNSDQQSGQQSGGSSDTNSNSNSSDQGSPDTATGDDDY